MGLGGYWRVGVRTELATIYRRGSFITCYVQKHGTEIIEVKVWHHIATCFEGKFVKAINVWWKMGSNLQHTSRNTYLEAF